MENILANNLIHSFKISFNRYIDDNLFFYEDNVEITNNNQLKKINFFLMGSKNDILLNLEYRFEYFVYFRIKSSCRNIYIRFDSFLTFKGYEKDNLLSLNQIEGNDIPEKFKNYCDYVVRILETDLKDVVEGKEWIDMPTDWMGYK